MRHRLPLVFHIIIIYNLDCIKGLNKPVKNSDNSNSRSNNNNSSINISSHSHINKSASQISENSTKNLSSSSQLSESSTEVHLSSSDIAQRLSQGHFEFTLKLYRSIVEESSPKDNIAFSPLLVSTLLTPTLLSAKEYANYLLEAGADNGSSSTYEKTVLLAQEIQKILSLNDLSERAAEAWHRATIASLQDQYYKNFLKAPRGILLLKKGTVPKTLEKSLQKWFGVALKTVTQHLGSMSVVNEINRWAANETKNKIKEFLQDSSLKARNSAMLSPAAVQSFWLQEFDLNKTYEKGLFYRSATERFEMPMMISRLKIPLGYSQNLEARVLELSFQLRRASLFIILPDHLEMSLSALESNVTPENIRSLLSTLKTEVVNLRLPKFYIDSVLSLVKPLRNLGVTKIFSQNSGLNIKTDDSTFIFPPDEFIHRVRFEIRENNEAVSSQSASQGTNSESQNPGLDEIIGKFDEKYFEVDHPFIFFIWDYIASTIICMGRVVDPMGDFVRES